MVTGLLPNFTCASALAHKPAATISNKENLFMFFKFLLFIFLLGSKGPTISAFGKRYFSSKLCSIIIYQGPKRTILSTALRRCCCVTTI
ncbi:hypothetical protein D3C87_1858750 [compost metagenome]